MPIQKKKKKKRKIFWTFTALRELNFDELTVVIKENNNRELFTINLL